MGSIYRQAEREWKAIQRKLGWALVVGIPAAVGVGAWAFFQGGWLISVAIVLGSLVGFAAFVYLTLKAIHAD